MMLFYRAQTSIRSALFFDGLETVKNPLVELERIELSSCALRFGFKHNQNHSTL